MIETKWRPFCWHNFELLLNETYFVLIFISLKIVPNGHQWFINGSGGCFTNVSRALQNNFAKIYNASNHMYGENFKLKLCTCAQSMALGTRTKFQIEMLIGSAISVTHKFRENILESSRNVSETPPGNGRRQAIKWISDGLVCICIHVISWPW